MTKGDQAMFNLDSFIADCRAALKETSSELAIKELVKRAVCRSADVEAALGTPRRGEIMTLHPATNEYKLRPIGFLTAIREKSSIFHFTTDREKRS